MDPEYKEMRRQYRIARKEGRKASATLLPVAA
jgi:hypothetical protein